MSQNDSVHGSAMEAPSASHRWRRDLSSTQWRCRRSDLRTVRLVEVADRWLCLTP